MSNSVGRWEQATKRIVMLIVLLALALVVYQFRTLLPPLVLAFLLAFVVDPLVDHLETRTRMSRTGATALVFGLLVLAMVAAPAVAVPPVVRAVRSLELDFARIAADVDQLIARPIVILEWEFDLQAVYQQFQQDLGAFVSSVAAGTVDVVLGFASTLFWLVFILLAAFYLTRDADRIVAWVESLPPPALQEDFGRLRQRITDVWHAFLRGQLLMALLLAGITTVAGAAVGLPNALALGLLAGAMEFVPSIGPFIAAVPAVAVAFFEGSSWLPLSNLWFAVLVLGLYLLIQQIEGNVLMPRILGRSLNLHPFVVLVAVIAGGSLAGVLGLLLAAPTVATLRVLGEYVYYRLTDQEPFPEAARPPPGPPGLVGRLWNWLRRRTLADRWVVRPGRPEDRADVEAISEKTSGGDDYVPTVWEEWLADSYGELVVVELKAQVVALGKLTRIAEDEWWIEGLRVDPAYQHLGVARLVQERQIQVAERTGRGVLRLGTGSYNRPVHRNVVRDGFRRVAEFVDYGAEPVFGPHAPRSLGPDDLDAAWNLVSGSRVLEASGGLYEVAWRWMALTRERLGAHLAAGDVRGVELEGELAALAVLLPEPDAESLWVSYVDGGPDEITVLAWGLRVLAGQWGCQRVRFRPPALPPLLHALEAAGVTRTKEAAMWVFERPLQGGDDDGREQH